MNISNISLLLKPSSHLCNLDCHYCFYKRAVDVYPENEMMTLDTVEAIIRKTLDMGGRINSFTWQGGEPTLMGLDFYREVCRLQDRYRRRGQIIENSLQTNGVLLDFEWADFLKKKNFLVGLSIDGPKSLHDIYRRDRGGRGSFSQVIRAARLLEEGDVPFNVLCLLTDANINKTDRLYSFFREKGFTHLQFIPCHELDTNGKMTTSSISGEELGKFHTRLFDLWMEDGFFEVSIRIFEDIFIYIMDGQKTSCGWLERCGSYLLVEHNGDAYPCDFFVYPEWKLGNFVSDPVENILRNPIRSEFGEMKAKIPQECNQCTYLPFCQGDCTKFRKDTMGGFSLPSAYCQARKMLFSHIEPHIEEVRERIIAVRRKETDPHGVSFDGVGRNDPCPCGSGRKYKVCCRT